MGARVREYVTHDNLPSLELVRLPHDHFGLFDEAVDGVNTVETEIADNDYAVGLLVEKVARSKYGKDTLIFVIEDDAQNGADHVDAHRSLALSQGHMSNSERLFQNASIRLLFCGRWKKYWASSRWA